ncbi:MAG: 16S rRNA (adenine(1518)-N(6)/adenine(1519)-N(6))-dimethyltransferase RsmA [bacterium]|nr:16S rRNA (adenine(1518)-N(6)/adenine(1519)-N(6))-dimethyltransferase RsmA [bacterium]
MKRGAKLGQHFLKAKWAARALAYAVRIAHGDTVLEIGPGKGALTRELLAIAKDVSAKVVAIEKDEALVALLNEKFANEIKSGKLIVVAGDIRDINQGETLKSQRSLLDWQNYVVAANIPYYITGEIIRKFLTAEAQPRAMALLVQKEVAKRVISNKESLLSLSVKAYGAPKIVMKVPRGNFSPAPNVDSAILLVENISRKFFSNISEELFFKVLHAGFKSKRKFLLNNLSGTFEKENAARAFAECNINPKARAEDVPLEKWGCLAQTLATRV